MGAAGSGGSPARPWRAGAPGRTARRTASGVLSPATTASRSARCYTFPEGKRAPRSDRVDPRPRRAGRSRAHGPKDRPLPRQAGGRPAVPDEAIGRDDDASATVARRGARWQAAAAMPARRRSGFPVGGGAPAYRDAISRFPLRDETSASRRRPARCARSCSPGFRAHHGRDEIPQHDSPVQRLTSRLSGPALQYRDCEVVSRLQLDRPCAERATAQWKANGRPGPARPQPARISAATTRRPSPASTE